MPRGDRTGPNGLGPMTGGARGFCAGFDTPGYVNNWNMFRGRGVRGRGYRHTYYATGLTGWQRGIAEAPGYAPMYPATPVYPAAPVYTREQEVEGLNRTIQSMEQQLESYRKRLDELESDSDNK